MGKSWIGWKLSLVVCWTFPGWAPAAAQQWGIPQLIPATQQGAMAYDSVHQQTVLFGGMNDSVITVTNTTWLWNGTVWTQVFPANSPTARFGHAMVFDSVRDQVVLFGGYDVSTGVELNDTWTWDGANWTQQSPHHMPPGRSGHAMAFDTAAGVTVMFGSYGLTDTWTWNGTDWTEATPQTVPPTRGNPAMAYAGAGQVVMFGGYSEGSTGQTSLADTWVWNGTTWIKQSPTNSPPASSDGGMVFDSVNNVDVLFGGYDSVSGTVYAQTWIWNGTNWTQKTPAASPSARTDFGIAYDSARQVTVVFGGALFSDTWTWNETNWTEAAPPTSPPPRSAHGMAYDGARQQVVMFGGARNGAFAFLETFAPYSDTWVWNGTIWTQKLPLTSPSARSGIVMAYDSAQQQTILFGGVDANGNHLSDTWAWDGTNWTELTTSGPSGRAFYAMAYDSLHQQIVLFGGENANQILSDTWVWNGSGWIEESPATSPDGRSRGAMAYDSVHQFAVLFGGTTGGGDVQDDTWIWNGTNWTRVFPEGDNPDSRAEHSMTFDSAHQYSLMMGGTNYQPLSGVTSNTWLYNGSVWDPGYILYVGSFAGLAFDAAHGKTVLFGGNQSGSNITEVYPANSIAATGGATQSAAPGQTFATPLQVTVTKLSGSPIANDTVTFSVSPTFATLSSTTATTNASGQAQITATSTSAVGSYAVTAVIADGGSATFALTNTGAGPAATITEQGGTGQSTTVGTAFAMPLTAVVKDAAGVALSGVTVTFAAPSTGATASFTPSASVQTNSQGVASVNIAAGSTAGGYNVTASVSGVTTPATFPLENAPGSAASITATGGGSQTAAIGMLFATPLTAVVKDSHGNPISGATVTFSAPSTGASAAFTPSAPVTTNAQGVATVTATANGTIGGFSVSASVSGVGTAATFALTNASAGPVTIAVTGGSGQSTPIGSAFATLLTAVVKNGGGNVIQGVSVTFAGPGSGPGATFTPSSTVTTDATGTATVTATANAAAGGPYNVTATVSGLTPATFALTNIAPTYTLGVSTLLEPPQSGSDSTTLVVRGTPNSWTNTSNASWLHLETASGSNSSLILFSFDANTGATRTGTMTIGGNTLTVTQAGASYVRAGMITLVAVGSAPRSLAVDHNNNLYIADGNIKEWNASTQTVSTLITAGTNGLGSATAVAVDGSENLYVVDGVTVKKWTAATQQLNTLISTGLTAPNSIAVDGNGNLYIGDVTVVHKWTASTQQLSALISSGLTDDVGVAVDPTGNVYATDSGGGGLGSPQVLKWSASTQQVTVFENSSAIVPNGIASDSSGNIYIADGSGIIEKWTASTQSLTLLVGSGLVSPGAVAVDSTGNLYIADGVLVRKWQASNQTLSTLFDDTFLAGSFSFQGVATDTAGDVYLADGGNRAVEKFNTATHQLSTVVTGIASPGGISLDSAGNVYIGNGYPGNVIQKWTASTQILSTVLSSAQIEDLSPTGVAVDSAGDIYFADFGNITLDEYIPATRQTTTLLTQDTLTQPFGVSVDPVGNYYVADSFNQSVYQGNAATQQSSALVPAGLNAPYDAQADRSGNVYIADSFTVNLATDVSYPGRVLKYSGATKQITVLASSGFQGPFGLAPDASGNVFVNDGNRLFEIVNGFVGATSVFEPATAGSDSLPAVIPATAPLYTTSSDQPWLTLTGTANGAVSFSFTANTTGAARVAHISVLGVTVTVTQVSNATTPVAIAATGGGGQSANVGTAFATVLSATVTGVAGADLSGISVAFSAPSAGASATLSSTTAQTNSSGVATVTVAANSTVGTYTVTATAAGVAIPATFTLTNTVASSAYSLASPTLLEPPAAGSDSILIVANGSPAAWSATAQAPWLQIETGSASGTGSAPVKFTFTANTGATRTGTITFSPGSLTLTVTQAGSTYEPAGLIPLVTSGLANAEGNGESGGITVDALDNIFITVSNGANLNAIEQFTPAAPQLNLLLSGLHEPGGVAVDPLEDLFIADTNSSSLKKWTAATQQISPLVSTGLFAPSDVALDTAGNAYIVDNGNNAVKKWTASTQQVSTLSSGLNFPRRIAVDGAGNVYFSDSGNNEIKKWTAATQQTSVLVSGLNGPQGVAVDRGGNVYFADSGNNLIKEWVASTQQVTVAVPASELPSSGGIDGVALDNSGNLFIDDGLGIYELPYALVGPANASEPNTAGNDSLLPVLPAGTFLGTPVSDQTWLTITGTAAGVVTFSFTVNPDAAVRVAHINVLGAPITVTQAAGQGTPAAIVVTGGNAQSAALNTAFGSPLTAVVEDAGGNPLHGISVTFASPASGASASFGSSATVTTNAQGIASVTATANGTLGSYTVTASVSGVAAPASFYLTNITASAYTATSSVVEPNTSGMDTIVIRANGTPGPWVASSNANWLHLLPGYLTGPGSGTVGFSFDPNPGAARSGAIAFNPGAASVTVTQAGSNYQPAKIIGAEYAPQVGGVTTDIAGNIYYCSSSGVIEFNPVTQKTSTPISFQQLPGDAGAAGVAVDAAGNVYASVQSSNEVVKWTASTKTLSTLISSGLKGPAGLAMDSAGNLYIFDTGSQSLKVWNASTGQLTTLYSGLTFNFYTGKPAIDALGNVYFIDSANSAVREWVASTEQVITIITGASGLQAIAIDPGGSFYFGTYSRAPGGVGNTYNLYKWSPLTQQFTFISSGFEGMADVATDQYGSVFIADSGAFEVDELPRAYIGPRSISEPAAAGSDSLLPVLPPSLPVYTPASNQNWLTITGATNGIISFSFTANTAATAGVGTITVLGVAVSVEQLGAAEPAATVTPAGGSGQNAAIGTAFATPLSALVKDTAGNLMVGVTVTFAGPASGAGVTFSPSTTAVTNDQGIATIIPTANATAGGPYSVTATVSGVTAGAPYKLTNTATSSYSVAKTSLLEPNTTGLDFVLIQATGSPAAWSAASNATWMHLDNGSLTGTGTAHVAFYYDANTGVTRSGTLTLNPGGFTVTVTQAGANYIPGGLITLDATQTNASGVAIDTSGNLYLNTLNASLNTAILKRSAASGQYTQLASGLTSSGGIAVDLPGNVYYSDESANKVYKWTATSQTSAPLITSGLSTPSVLAVDSAGNVYIGDTGGIKMWNGSQLTTLTTFTVQSLCVDTLGNVYGAQTGNNLILEWIASTQQAILLVPGLTSPGGLAVDGAGNLYIGSNDGTVRLWSPVTGQLTTLASLTYDGFNSAAVDAQDNVYLTSYEDGLQEVVHGFIGPATISEPAAAGSDALLAAIPATAPLGGPKSSASWLTIGSTTNGVVGFSFAANSGAASQTAQITAMGATINVTQAGTASNPGSIASTGGSGQGAAVSTAFSTVLTAIVKDGNGNPLTGASVTFAGPGSGAGATFTPSATVTTNNQGIATVTAAANATAGGPYTVTATVAGVAAPAMFTLTNFGAPASVTVVTGSGQRTLTGTAFATPLEAVVKDSGGNTLAGVTVTFAGGNASFSPAASVQTDSAGVAIVTATANGTLGSYSVTASVGSLNAVFSLTNDAPASLTASGGTPQTASLSVQFAAPLQVTVKDSGGNLLNGVTVNFAAPGSGASATLSSASAITNANGVASVMATANGTSGTYNVTASVSAVSGTAAFSLTNSSFSPCDPTHNGSFDIADAQRLVNEALGMAAAIDDLNSDGKVNAVDVQIVINAVLQKGCSL